MTKFRIDGIISHLKKALGRFLLLWAIFSAGAALPAWAVGTQGVLSGTVFDKDTGKGLNHVRVTVQSAGETYKAVTDARGFFSIAGLPAGNYTATLRRSDYVTGTFSYITVTADATTSLRFPLVSTAVEVPGITVTAPRIPLANPRQTMTNYGYSSQEIKKIFPAAASNSLVPIYESLPGVGVGYDAYYGSGTPHIRGGTGSDVAYAFDGVPTYEPITNTYGTPLNYVGTSRTDVYVGGYPAQYGNFLSGYINQVAGQGSGNIHGYLEYQSGFWTDPGAKLPSYNPSDGSLAAYNGAGPASPANINFEIQGKDRRFSYYVNHLIQDGGLVSYPQGVDLKPNIAETGGLEDGQQNRDTVMNFHYDLNDDNALQLLYYTGIQKINFAGYQELPCNPNDLGSNCLGTNTATGFGETYNANVITPLPDMYQIAMYDLEKLEWNHRFKNNPGEVLNLRTWRYNPTVTFNYFTSPLNARWQFRRAAETGLQAEYQDQLTPKHLLDAGLTYLYSNNFLISDKNDIGAPNASGSYVASGNLIQYPFVTGSSGGFVNLHTQAVPDTITWAGWATDEWRPTPKWDFYAGLRWDKQQYQILPGFGENLTPFMLGVPGYTSGVSLDPGLTQPSFISPRAGASYQFSDKLTLKASYGKFITFAPARRVEIITGAQDSNGLAYTQGISNFIPGFTAPPGTIANAGVQKYGFGCPDTSGCYRFPGGTAESLPGNRPQIGEDIDVSWEYQPDNDTYFKLTPYIKHIKDPLESFTVQGLTQFVNGGVIESKGIELYVKRRLTDKLGGWLSYTYSSTRGSQIPFQTALESNAVALCSPALGCSANPPFSTAVTTADNNQMVPMPYDQRHVLSLNLNYKVGKWEFSPSFTYGSGYPYGLGYNNLLALSALQDSGSVLYGGTRTPAQSASFLGFTNPLNETTYDSLRMPGWWLGNMAVTYHISSNVDAVLNVFNIFNSNQILQVDNSVLAGLAYPELTNPNLANSLASSNAGNCCYVSQDGSQNILPQYNPLKGQYAPFGFPNLRQFYLSLDYKFQ